MKGKIIHLLKLAIDDFKKFTNRLAVFALTYGWPALILIGLSMILPTFLHTKLGMPHDVSLTISRILLTITPIIPTLVFVKAKNEDYSSDEYSMDLCFTSWIITIVFAWRII